MYEDAPRIGQEGRHPGCRHGGHDEHKAQPILSKLPNMHGSSAAAMQVHQAVADMADALAAGKAATDEREALLRSEVNAALRAVKEHARAREAALDQVRRPVTVLGRFRPGQTALDQVCIGMQCMFVRALQAVHNRTGPMMSLAIQPITRSSSPSLQCMSHGATARQAD
jgi:hypothetical protein